MQLISAFQLMQGYKPSGPLGYNSVTTSMVQPLQMLPYEKKDDEWRVHNMNWGEMQGLQQIRHKYKRITKNFQLANGIIDKSDYIVEETNENKDLIDVLTRNADPPAMTQLQFFPLIPNVVDLLEGEFLKRNNKVVAYAVDELSRNEKLDKKKELVDMVLTQQAQVDIIQNMLDMGIDMESEEAQQQLSPEAVQSLPDVERFMRKSYRSIVEQWSTHTMNADKLRFKMNEQEAIGFRDSIVANEEFWEIMMLEDDYLPRVLDPRTVFYHKSPNKKYISEGNFAGYIELMTVADVIDTYGYKMTEEEIRGLESIMPGNSNVNYLLDLPNDGSYYDSSKSYRENALGPSLQYNRLTAFNDAFDPNRSGHSLFDFLLDGNVNVANDNNLLRVTTYYWKSQKKVAHLTKIDEFGQTTQAIVSEDFKITEKPYYDTTFYKEKTKDNLIFGEHLDWIWINEVWGGLKIGSNTGIGSGVFNNPSTGFQPIYLGIGDKKRPDRLSFQFKSNSSLYGAPLPMEGLVFSERSTKSFGLVDRMKPYQIGHNMVNNQILDILIDELGTVIVIDQNMLPQHSTGESWGKNNLAKAYVAMKNFQMLPLDTSLANTESVTHFNNMTKLDASQTERLLGRIQLGEYFRLQALASIGITQERMGTVNSQQTATGTQTAVSNSYAQTEKYFTQHSDFLMPRVWELIISASQYYTSQKKKSGVLSYRNDKDEDVIFELPDALDVFPRDIDIYCTTSFEKKDLKAKLEALATENNTTGASLYDLGKMFALDTPTEILEALKESELKMERAKQQEAQYKMEIDKQNAELRERERLMEMTFEAEENAKDRQAKIAEAQIRAAGYPDTSDDGSDEYLKRLEVIQGQQEYRDTVDFKREQETSKNQLAQDQMNLKREDLQTKREVAATNLAIARENQTEAELAKRRKEREQRAKAKKAKK